MTRTNTPAEDVEALAKRSKMPKNERRARHAAHAEAAKHGDVSPARLGAELAEEERPTDETETADSIKRAAENDGRV
jgi:hypothetical protein